MSKWMKAFGALGIAFVAAQAWAHGTKTQMVVHAIQATTTKFEKDHKDLVTRYTGIKGWPVGADVAVRVYMTEDKSLKYSCYEHEMDGHEMMMCDEEH